MTPNMINTKNIRNAVSGIAININDKIMINIDMSLPYLYQKPKDSENTMNE